MKSTQFVPGTIVTILMFLFIISTAHDACAEAKSPKLPETTLNAEQIVELFSGNTVESETAVRGRTSISYYAPNGEVRQLRNETKRTGRWRVNNDGRMCLQMEDLPEKCRIIVYEDGEYRKYIVKKNGQHQHSVTYHNFQPGNPYGL